MGKAALSLIAQPQWMTTIVKRRPLGIINLKGAFRTYPQSAP
jgi:hypothetical protein